MTINAQNTRQVHKQPITGPLAWTTDQVQGKQSFCRQLDEHHLLEIDHYLSGVRDRELTDITVADLAGGHLRKFMDRARTDIQDGLGMLIIQGCNLQRYSREDFERIFWMMGLFLGTPISQSVFGERIAHVRHAPNNPSNRTYRTTRELIHHTDTPDALGLMCVRTAKSAGSVRQ